MTLASDPILALSREELEWIARVDPEGYTEIQRQIEYRTLEEDRELYEDSLIAFFERAWREIDPASLSINWHHRVVAEALEDVSFGRNRDLIINIPPRHTKAAWVDTPVFTTTGWKRHGDIVPGDYVFGPDGNPKRVLGVTPKSVQPTYTVLFDDGASLVVTGDHLWGVERCRSGRTEPTVVETRNIVLWDCIPISAPGVSAGEAYRFVVSVMPAGDRLVNCISVEGDLYLAGRQFVTTHNSLLVNVMWPAWTWIQPPERKGPLSGPHVKFLCVSYAATLAEEMGLKMLRLVAGDWYRSLWGDRVKLLGDQQSRASFGNKAGGERISNSIEGGLLGRGGDIRLTDDPQTRKGADSQVERAASLAAMSDLTTRFTDPRIAAQVLIMQRLGTLDATDWALKNWPRSTVHLMFPARFERERACFADPRTWEGELLWPAVWTDEELTKIENGLAAIDGEILSDRAIAGQLQQNPKPRGGGIINDDDWNVWPEWVPSAGDTRVTSDGSVYIPLPEVSHVILSLDTALSEKTTADWNYCLVLGIWHRPNRLVQIVGSDDQIDDGEQPRVIIMGGWRRRCKLNDDAKDRFGRPMGLVQLVADTARRYPVNRIIIENKTRGLDVKNELQRQFADEDFHIQLFEPKKHGDKVARLHSVQPLFSQGLVYLPANCRLVTDQWGEETVHVGEFDWARQLMDEVSALPHGDHDDGVDALSQGLIQLRSDGLISLTQEYVRQQVALRMHRQRKNTIRESYGV